MQKILVINRKGGCGKSTLALSLAQVLPKAELVDLDPQKTLTEASKVTGKHKPIKSSEATGNFLIFDTPPYESSKTAQLLGLADLILMPVLLGYPDLLSTRAIVKQILELKVEKKACLVYSKVRKPWNKAQYAIKALFAKSFPRIRIANTALSELKDFQEILAKNLSGLGREQVEGLVQELALVTSF